MNCETAQRKFRVLFGIPEGDYYAREFLAVAAAMPVVESRFVGFSWSTGTEVRKAEIPYSYVPFFAKNEPASGVPALAEFNSRGHFRNSVPVSARCAFSALSRLVESELAAFTPDIVVYGPIDHCVCYLLDQMSQLRGIPRLGVQPCFISRFFLAQSVGESWMKYLREADLSVAQGEGRAPASPVKQMRRVPLKKQKWDAHLWMRGGESALRVFFGGTTFDTPKSLLSLFTSRIAPNGWLPSMAPLLNLDAVAGGFVLVALHQPVLSWETPKLLDLVHFAIDATPENFAIVLRPHPVETAQNLPESLQQALVRRRAWVSRAGSGPELALLVKECRAIITLNSAIGVEGLFAGKPVFTLAPSYYSRPGLAHAVTPSDAPRVREMIGATGRHLPDPAVVAQYAEWLMRDHMLPHPSSGPQAAGLFAEVIRSKIAGDANG